MGHEKDHMFEEVLKELIYLGEKCSTQFTIDEYGVKVCKWEKVENGIFELNRLFTLEEVNKKGFYPCVNSFITEFWDKLERKTGGI